MVLTLKVLYSRNWSSMLAYSSGVVVWSTRKISFDCKVHGWEQLQTRGGLRLWITQRWNTDMSMRAAVI